jgi:uncharacterized protein (DUF1330 family)
MTAYALAHLHDPRPHPEVVDYIGRVQATLEPFSGRFIAHGPTVEVQEGTWPGTVVIIEFPAIEQARAWYDSPGYRAILPLRTNNIRSDAIIFDGVGPDYDASHVAAIMRTQLTTPN